MPHVRDCKLQSEACAPDSKRTCLRAFVITLTRVHAPVWVNADESRDFDRIVCSIHLPDHDGVLGSGLMGSQSRGLSHTLGVVI